MQGSDHLNTQLEWIRHLQRLRSLQIDEAISILDFFDSWKFVFILIPLVWLGYGWKSGIRLYAVLGISILLNYWLKIIFALPRPFNLDPSLGVIHVEGYGFPSGAAQNSLLLAGLLILHGKSKWKWIIAPIYALTIAFSRVYLGVHFPMDILGGWIFGAIILFSYWLFLPKIENLLQATSSLKILIISQAIVLLILFVFPFRLMISLGACGMGLGIGIFIVQHYQLKLNRFKHFSELMVRSVIGICGVFLLHLFFLKTFTFEPLPLFFFHYLFIGFWISYVAYYTCINIAKLWIKK